MKGSVAAAAGGGVEKLLGTTLQLQFRALCSSVHNCHVGKRDGYDLTLAQNLVESLRSRIRQTFRRKLLLVLSHHTGVKSQIVSARLARGGAMHSHKGVLGRP